MRKMLRKFGGSIDMSSNASNVLQGNPLLLSRREAAEYLGISKQTLAIWNCTGRYRVPFIKIGRLVKYRKSDLDAFIASNLKGASWPEDAPDEKRLIHARQNRFRALPRGALFCWKANPIVARVMTTGLRANFRCMPSLCIPNPIFSSDVRYVSLNALLI